MPNKLHDRKNATHPAAGQTGGKVRGLFFLKLVLLNCALALSFVDGAQAGTYLTLSTSLVPAGATITQPSNLVFQTSFGNVNALGIGPASQTNVSINPQAAGALYYTPIRATVGCLFGNCSVTASVSTNFTHPAALIVNACPSGSSCVTPASYSTLTAAATNIVSPSVPNNTTATIGLGVFVPDNNGGSAYAGADTATVTFTVIDTSFFNIVLETDTLSFDLPKENVQTAVRLDLASDPAGLAINPAADYSMNFGTVNALGIGPGAGLTTVAAGGGIIYSTPYRWQPAFTGFASASATVKVYVSTDFAHAAVLQLYDSGAGAGPYSAISKSSVLQTQITNAAGSRTTNTRYLGLFVSNLNGASAFSGTDNATLTYTLTVP